MRLFQELVDLPVWESVASNKLLKKVVMKKLWSSAYFMLMRARYSMFFECIANSVSYIVWAFSPKSELRVPGVLCGCLRWVGACVLKIIFCGEGMFGKLVFQQRPDLGLGVPSGSFFQEPKSQELHLEFSMEHVVACKVGSSRQIVRIELHLSLVRVPCGMACTRN